MENLLKDKQLIPMAEHYDFFDKIVLYIDKEERFRIRLHLFSGEDSNKYRPHCHRWDYSTLILNGSYRHNIFGVDKNINKNTNINDLEPILIRDEKIGSIYSLSNKIFHSIAAQKDTVSLFVRGPALRDRFLIMDKKAEKTWWEYGRESETIEEINSKSLSPKKFKNIYNKLYNLVLKQ